jgi:hypothetical protein
MSGGVAGESGRPLPLCRLCQACPIVIAKPKGVAAKRGLKEARSKHANQGSRETTFGEPILLVRPVKASIRRGN